MLRPATLIVACLVLAGCQMTLPKFGRGTGDAVSATTSPITGDAIEVTSLDAPTAAAPATEMAPAAVIGAETVVPESAPAGEAPALSPVEAAAEPEPAAAQPSVAKSPAQMACEKQKGVWTSAGSGSANFCQKPTRDGGKSCSKSSDCDGYCLARSQTCAPITPMFGCQEILNENGRMLTECIN